MSLRSEKCMKGDVPKRPFRGEGWFGAATPEGGSTRFAMREEYTGPMLPLVWRSMPDLQPSFEQFARGLKARAEHG